MAVPRRLDVVSWAARRGDGDGARTAPPTRNPRPFPLSSFFFSPSPFQAVIGAGAAGLATARELTRAGHAVTIFEQARPKSPGDAGVVGGVWVYTDETEEEGGQGEAGAGGDRKSVV